MPDNMLTEGLIGFVLKIAKSVTILVHKMPSAQSKKPKPWASELLPNKPFVRVIT
jgi:hypothetical protein